MESPWRTRGRRKRQPRAEGWNAVGVLSCGQVFPLLMNLPAAGLNTNDLHKLRFSGSKRDLDRGILTPRRTEKNFKISRHIFRTFRFSKLESRGVRVDRPGGFQTFSNYAS